MNTTPTSDSQSHQDEQAEKKSSYSDLLKPIGSLRGSQMTKIVMICVLMLLLQIPIYKIDDTIRERQVRSSQAMEEIASKWGRQQSVIGPIITVPFERKVVREAVGANFPGSKTEEVIVEYAHFLAEDLRIDAQTDNSLRHRGIFEIPVYRVDITMAGRFHRPDFSDLGVEPSRILWERATLTVLIADPRTITNQAALLWNEEKIDFQTGSRDILGAGKGIEVSLKDKLGADSFAFSCQLSLAGQPRSFLCANGAEHHGNHRVKLAGPEFSGRLAADRAHH